MLIYPFIVILGEAKNLLLDSLRNVTLPVNATGDSSGVLIHQDTLRMGILIKNV